MRVFPKPADWILAFRVYRRFRERPGSDHIASWCALACLAAIVRKYRPKEVLEFGCGIGAITYLLLSASSEIRVLGIESNGFCLDQLDQNIPAEFGSRLDVARIGDDRTDRQFDLLIIDGKYDPNGAFFRPGTICFIEGSRPWQAAQLVEIAKGKGLAIDLDRQLTWLPRVKARKFHLRWRRSGLDRRSITFCLPVLRALKSCKIGTLASSVPQGCMRSSRKVHRQEPHTRRRLLPAMPHDTAAASEYVTRVTAMGPLGIEYVDLVDDPRQLDRR